MHPIITEAFFAELNAIGEKRANTGAGTYGPGSGMMGCMTGQPKMQAVPAPAPQSGVASAGAGPKLAGVLRKAAGIAQGLKEVVTGAPGRGLHLNELAGLGLIAAPVVDELQAGLRSQSPEEAEHKRLTSPNVGHALDLAGLATLMAPAAHHFMPGH